MSKMKHLLKKLHIGGGIHGHQRLAETRPVSNPNAGPSASSSSNGRTVVVETTPVDRPAGDGATGLDFNFLEEEFQVQLALAISASDPDGREDPESAQIDAAKRISLGCPVAPVTITDTPVESLSLRYWSYNFVNYNERVVDGFYDVHSINSSSVIQGKMPLLVDLQAMSVSDNINYEVILVNRVVDPEVQELEKKAYAMSLECCASDGLILNGLIQRIADIVVDKMGGPVGDADEMSKRWTKRSCELRNALNTVIIPLGCLDIGLSRHRALLFKVLADRICLPCMLVKGSYYTGTDDGAVNLIKIDHGSEYIVDLMGAPGTLIPTEVPISHLLNAGIEIRGLVGPAETPRVSSLVLGEGPGAVAVSSVGIKTNDVDNKVEKNKTQMFEHEFGKLSSCEISADTGKFLGAQKIKVNDVSQYVITAAKNSEFAQKLHAFLLDGDASPPSDLFLHINPQDLSEQKIVEQVHPTNRCCKSDELLSMPGLSLVSVAGHNSPSNFKCDDEQEKYAGAIAGYLRGVGTNVLNSEVSFPSDTTCEGFALINYQANEKLTVVPTYLDAVPLNPPGPFRTAIHDDQVHESSLQSAVKTCHSQPQHDNDDNRSCFQGKVGVISDVEMSRKSSVDWFEIASNTMQNGYNDYNDRIDPLLGEVAAWEIPWEDLQIGERIGIGSYGEVYHADWNGTEVAVKKFLDQDFSGDALVQFKCEAGIMLRLRHPNVVLFMGAVTRPPHLSILTEFLPRGSLYKLLHRPNPLLDEKRRMKMALDVAKGMNYLHTSHPTIVHRDLKSPNLLVDKNWAVKVCDFGLSRMKHHTFLSSKSTAGTV
uniref:non-specific serine/threonine protein kinase n=1 Tax=Rhizophora mucronata TaxID=61149 RepID=A0A2P2L9X1_RHIMU